jgi:hypothetical protein
VLNEEEKDDWHYLKPSGVEFDEQMSCDANVSVCETQSVDQLTQDHLTCEDDDDDDDDDEYKKWEKSLLRTK